MLLMRFWGASDERYADRGTGDRLRGQHGLPARPPLGRKTARARPRYAAAPAALRRRPQHPDRQRYRQKTEYPHDDGTGGALELDRQYLEFNLPFGAAKQGDDEEREHAGDRQPDACAQVIHHDLPHRLIVPLLDDENEQDADDTG